MIPPPGILFVLCLGAGLATGLSHFWGPVCGGAIALGVICTVRHRGVLFLVTLLVGALMGVVSRRYEASTCVAMMPVGGVRIDALVLEPVAGGGAALVQPLRAGCNGGITARFPRGESIDAGFTVRLEGEWERREAPLARADGSLQARQVSLTGREGSAVFSLRNGLARTSARLYGERAPLVDALVAGRRSGMDPELKAAFASSGLVHLLSISGFHIGLIAAWVVLLLRRLNVPRATAMATAAALSTVYVAFLGWPAPAVRACAMAWVLAGMRQRQRAVQPDALLATTALAVLLLDPMSVLDLGAWLSVLSLWGAVRFARWTGQAGGTHWLWQSTASSVGATVATAPATAWLLGAVAPVGILLNFVAIPVAAVAVPGVLASLLVAPLGMAVAGALAAGSGAALNLLELTAQWGARVPAGHLLVAQEPGSALPWVLLLLVLCWATPSLGNRAFALGRLLLAGTAVVWAALVPSWRRDPGAGQLMMQFVDVGQGDGAVLRTPHGHFIVIDAGPRDDHFDAGQHRVVPLLARDGARSLDLVVASHAHADHVGGLGAVLAELPVAAVLEPAAPTTDSVYREFLTQVAQSSASWARARRGEQFVLDSVHFTVLHPDTAWSGWGLDLNDDSVVLLVQYGGFRAIFMGDAGVAPEEVMRGRVGHVDLLKVGHHGSATASSSAWLAELSPVAAVVSVGSRNRYGHPAPEALERLGAQHATIWRTDQEGTVTVVTDGRHVNVEGRKQHLAFDVTLSPATISLESRRSCGQPSPPSSASSSTRNEIFPTPRESSRTCSTTSLSPPS